MKRRKREKERKSEIKREKGEVQVEGKK